MDVSALLGLISVTYWWMFQLYWASSVWRTDGCFSLTGPHQCGVLMDVSALLGLISVAYWWMFWYYWPSVIVVCNSVQETVASMAVCVASPTHWLLWPFVAALTFCGVFFTLPLNTWVVHTSKDLWLVSCVCYEVRSCDWNGSPDWMFIASLTAWEYWGGGVGCMCGRVRGEWDCEG